MTQIFQDLLIHSRDRWFSEVQVHEDEEPSLDALTQRGKMGCALQGLSVEALTPRLRGTLQRILTQSLARFRASIIAAQSTWMAALAREMGTDVVPSLF